MERATRSSTLRLINTGDARTHRAPTPRDTATDAAANIASENANAAAMSPFDARWVLAVRIVQSLDGGRQAILPPDRRENLVRLATRLGLREFDANLVIAIVQDEARTGHEPLSASLVDRLRLVRPPPRSGKPVSTAWLCAQIAIAVFGGLVLALALVQWVTG